MKSIRTTLTLTLWAATGLLLLFAALFIFLVTLCRCIQTDIMSFYIISTSHSLIEQTRSMVYFGLGETINGRSPRKAIFECIVLIITCCL